MSIIKGSPTESDKVAKAKDQVIAAARGLELNEAGYDELSPEGRVLKEALEHLDKIESKLKTPDDGLRDPYIPYAPRFQEMTTQRFQELEAKADELDKIRPALIAALSPKKPQCTPADQEPTEELVRQIIGQRNEYRDEARESRKTLHNLWDKLKAIKEESRGFPMD